MRQLFRPNAFSRRTPQFSAANEAETQSIHRLLHEAYPRIAATDILRVGAFELNSQNWRIHSARGDFILKCVEAARHTALAAQAFVCHELQQGGLAVPEFEPDRFGNLVAQHEGRAFCVTHFVSGEYFGADRAQWHELLILCASLMKRCALLEPAATLPHMVFFSPDDVQTVNTLQGGAEIRGLDREGKELIFELFQMAHSHYQGQSNQSGRGIFHVDIHPHNLICSGAEVALLTDFESFRVTDPFHSLGFGLFKCLRELLVDCSEPMPALLGKLKEDCARVFPAHTLRSLIEAARADLLRRALSITRELIRSGQARWEFMLETQLTGLAETQHLCAILST